jgi:hypothetical protein
MSYYTGIFFLCFVYLNLLASSANAMHQLLIAPRTKRHNNYLLAPRQHKNHTNNCLRFYSPKWPAQVIPRLSQKKFKELTAYAYSFLNANKNQAVCERGESGFVRISVPPVKELLGDIEKIRINYWPLNIKISDENIHSHTRSFESMIINGNYTHEHYEQHDQIVKDHVRYRIYKEENNQKNYFFECTVGLKLSEKRSHNEGDIIVFPKEFIHRLSSVAPNTLSINVVFKESHEYYNVFLPEMASIEDLRIEMGILSDGKAKECISEIIDIMKITMNHTQDGLP